MTTMIRADQVGSLLRPPEVLAARAEHSAGTRSVEDLRTVEDRAVLDTLAMQREAGLPVLTDGELRRETWYLGPAGAIDGLDLIDDLLPWLDESGNQEEERLPFAVAGAKLSARHRFTEIESTFLAAHAGRPYKVTLPSPVMAGLFFRPGHAPGVYDTPAQLVPDLVRIWIAEIAGLVADGAAYVQLDEGFSGLVAEQSREQMSGMGLDLDEVLAGFIAAENAIYDTVDRERVTLAIHICRGNARSRHGGAGGYEPIAEQVFSQLHVDRFLLEYDTGRAGGFEPLRHVPAGKVAVLGLISSKVGELESEDAVVRRIEEATRYAPVERLALSPQCGFASTKEGNLLSPDQQRRKLELTVRVAEKVWGSVTS